MLIPYHKIIGSSMQKSKFINLCNDSKKKERRQAAAELLTNRGLFAFECLELHNSTEWEDILNG